MFCCVSKRQLIGPQRGSALLLVLIFMAVLARMALSGVDSALLGTALALNYRDHDRVFHTAEALLIALDAALLARIESEGLQVTLDTLPDSEVKIVMSTQAVEQTGAAELRYHTITDGFKFDFPPQSATDVVVCGPLFQVVVKASGARWATHVHLGLERRACCDDAVACETGDFVSMSRHWRRLD